MPGAKISQTASKRIEINAVAGDKRGGIPPACRMGKRILDAPKIKTVQIDKRNTTGVSDDDRLSQYGTFLCRTPNKKTFASLGEMLFYRKHQKKQTRFFHPCLSAYHGEIPRRSAVMKTDEPGKDILQMTDMQQYLKPTYFIDSDHPDIISFSKAHCRSKGSDIEKAVSLNLAVRDGIRYNPYNMDTADISMKASSTLKRGDGYCVAKAVLLAACIRSQDIPARLGFADVKNHLNTKRLKELMETDTFIYHGYTEIYLNHKWVKATPAFNLELCTHFNVKPLDFDGIHDSIFHPFDQNGNRHMEYVKDHGTFADLPWEKIVKALIRAYPNYYKDLERRKNDFSKEALKENS